MKIKITLTVGAITLLSACANFASNKRACEEAPGLLPLPYSFIGNVFQVGPCASIEALRIEVGVELEMVRGGVISAMEKNEPNPSFDRFSENMGCQPNVNPHLLKVLHENTLNIFGPNYSNSNREAVRNVRKIIFSDPDLKQACT